MIKAKKKFGQNFLKDESVLLKIIQSMPNENRKVVEIGPGLGDLTQKLLTRCKKVRAFEIDLELCDYLRDKFVDEIGQERLELICNDILDYWEDKKSLDIQYDLIANLPYYIATNLILKALDDKECKNIIVMVQKEVAVKFSSHVGDRAYSALSILAESVSDAEILFDVGSEYFDPPPKVISAVLKLSKFRNYSDLFKDQKELDQFKSFLKVAFSAPRKVLIKNLGQIAKKDDLLKYFKNLDIPTNYRPHQLSSDKYHLLFQMIGKKHGKQKW